MIPGVCNGWRDFTLDPRKPYREPKKVEQWIKDG